MKTARQPMTYPFVSRREVAERLDRDPAFVRECIAILHRRFVARDILPPPAGPAGWMVSHRKAGEELHARLASDAATAGDVAAAAKIAKHYAKQLSKVFRQEQLDAGRKMQERARWVKSPSASVSPVVSVYLSVDALAPGGAASFGVTFHGATLPSVAVPSCDEARRASALGDPHGETGRLHLIAEAGGTSFIVVPLQQATLNVGRNGLWRLREELAGALPEPLRTVLTRGRTGRLAATANGTNDPPSKA